MLVPSPRDGPCGGVRAAWTVLVLALLLAGCTASTTEVKEPERFEVTRAASFVIPSLAAPPTFDAEVHESEYAGTLRLEGEFVLARDPALARVHPFTMQLGSFDGTLHLGIVIGNVSPNPYFPPRQAFPDFLEILLAEDEDALSIPSDSFLASTVDDRSGGSGTITSDGYWNGTAWATQDDKAPTRTEAGLPVEGRWAWGSVLNGSDLHHEFRIPRTSPLADVDGFQRPDGAPFRLALKFARQTQGAIDGTAPLDDLSDTFPGEGESPEAATDPSGWWRLRFAS